MQPENSTERSKRPGSSNFPELRNQPPPLIRDLYRDPNSKGLKKGGGLLTRGLH